MVRCLASPARPQACPKGSCTEPTRLPQAPSPLAPCPQDRVLLALAQSLSWMVH